jgi:hypothetical protein
MATRAKVDFPRTMHYNDKLIKELIMKFCKICNLEKTFDEFVKHKRYKDGFYYLCKLCMRQKNKEYIPTKEAKEKRLKKKAEFREINRDKIREQDRKNYKKNPEKFIEKARKNMKKYLARDGFNKREKRFSENPEIKKARLAIRQYVRSGKLIKPEICEICKKHVDRIEGHHNDYSKYLDVNWLCVPCHRKIHRKVNCAERLSELDSVKEYAIVRSEEETFRDMQK